MQVVWTRGQVEAITPPADRLPAANPPARLGAALLVLALMPFPILLWTTYGLRVGYDYETVLFPVDAAFAVIILASASFLVRSLLRRHGPVGTQLLALLTAVMAVAWAFHPSARGAVLILELAGTASLAGVIWEHSGRRASRLVAAGLGAIAAMETIWSGLQIVLGHGLGLHSLGEYTDPFLMVGGGHAPFGSLVHCYVLAALALVASGALIAVALVDDRPRLWCVAAGIAVMPVGWTFSRSALLGLVMMVACLTVGAVRPGPLRGRYRSALLAIAVGAGAAGAVSAPGWLGRASSAVHAGSTAQVTTDRTWLIHESEVLIGAHPVTGVGPGQYIPALRAHYGVEQNSHVFIFKAVHNLVLLAAAEGGILAGLIMALLLLALGWRAWRAGPAALGLYLAFLPFCLLDHLAWSFPQGLVILGVWVGSLDGASRPEQPAAAEA